MTQDHLAVAQEQARADRELLELAAKAAGIVGHFANNGADAGLFLHDPSNPSVWKKWHPLKDDGDALRLAVKLRLVIQHASKYVVVMDVDRDIAEHQDTRENNGDDGAATRRAIVLAAAAIGSAA